MRCYWVGRTQPKSGSERFIEINESMQPGDFNACQQRMTDFQLSHLEQLIVN